MTKLSRKPIDPEIFGFYVNNLWSAFTLLDSKDDIRLLFKDLFTHTEYKMFAKRLEIARRLINEERYEDIQKSLSVTPNTVTRVNNILAEKGDGLRLAHGKLEKLEEKYFQKEREKIKNLENPFRGRIRARKKTVLGTLLKAGAVKLDKAISLKLKQRTAKTTLLE